MLSKIKMTAFGFAAAATAATTLPATAQDLSGEIVVDGSSTVYPITQLVAEVFIDDNEDVAIPVSFSGTGGGFKKFAAGETHVSNASRPIKKKELDALSSAGIDFIEIPVAYDGLTIAVNRNNTWVDQLTVEQLQLIFLASNMGDVTTWQDVDPDWPAVEIKFFIPGTDSGTFDYFKEVIVGKAEDAIRDDVTPSENDHDLVRGISGDRGGIGFFGCAYFFENEDQLKAVPIVNSDGEAITPSVETIEDGTYNPFARPLFIYVREDALDRAEVAAFIEFYLDEGPELCEEVGYVRLPDVIYDRARVNVENRRTGTQYLDADGNKVEGPVTEVYQ